MLGCSFVRASFGLIREIYISKKKVPVNSLSSDIEYYIMSLLCHHIYNHQNPKKNNNSFIMTNNLQQYNLS